MRAHRTIKPKEMSEATLERKLVAWCKNNGVLTYKFSSPSKRGVPDRILIYNNITLFLELKREGKKPTELQYKRLREINEHGGVNAIAKWAAGLDEAIRVAELTLGIKT